MTVSPSPGNPPTAILTEILGVLVEDLWTRAAAQLADRTGTDPRRLQAAFLARLPSFARGGEDLEAFYREVALATDLSIGEEEFAAVLLDTAIEPVPENRRFYEELRATRGVRLVAVSNIPGPVYEAIDRTIDLGTLFDESVLSYRDEMAKPNAQVYIEAIGRSGVPPGEILFVDVSEEDVAGAREWGLRSVRVPDPSGLVPALTPYFSSAD